ncbi:unnamed protein product [Cladocopium goreaui]|uniref:Uncharacterized protein n=1 Tax=Cladocopium goreaui TaxID=2562237 RepID=A0A9P1BP30_9DINO|nr:unnamed protein product [Cladocopium goreaui]
MVRSLDLEVCWAPPRAYHRLMAHAVAFEAKGHAPDAKAAAELDELAKQQDFLGRETDEELLEDIQDAEQEDAQPIEEPLPPPPEPVEEPSEPFDELADSMTEAPKAGLVISLPSGSGIPGPPEREAQVMDRLTTVVGKLQDAANTLEGGPSAGSFLQVTPAAWYGRDFL